MTNSPVDRTVVDHLAAAAKAQPDRVVVRIDQTDVTADWWWERSGQAAAAFLHLDVEPAHRVVTLLSNRPETLIVWIGLAMIGAVEVPINTAMRGDLLVDQVIRSGAKIVVAEDEMRDPLEEILDRLGDVSVVWVGGTGDDLRSLLEMAPTVELPPPPEPDDESLVLYTSGTTGRSKGVVLTHRANSRLARSVIEYVGISGTDVLFTAFPLFHVAARFVSVMPALVTGGKVVVHRRFSASRFWEICRAEGITAIHYLGTLPMMLYNQASSPADRNHRVRVAYGAGMPADIWGAFAERFAIERVHELYGSTEQGIVTINTTDHQVPGTCGKAVSYAQVEIHDDMGRALGTGEDGEIVVRPREPGILFRRYDGMPGETVDAWRNLWFHTGDRGRLDDDGNLIFLGRIKDAIRRRGENVSAFEVEQVLDSHPEVIESAVVGVPSDLGEEEILAVVVADSGLDVDRLVEYCSAHLPSFAVPRFLRFVDSLPKNSSERVLKHELGFIDETTVDRQADLGVPGGAGS